MGSGLLLYEYFDQKASEPSARCSSTSDYINEIPSKVNKIRKELQTFHSNQRCLIPCHCFVSRYLYRVGQYTSAMHLPRMRKGEDPSQSGELSSHDRNNRARS